MRRDPTEFRERFKRWKAGEKVYDAGTPISGYKEWKNRIKQYKGLDVDNDNTYDYLSYYNNHTDEAWGMLNNAPDAHFYDTYKTAYHPTFSNESMYSGNYDTIHNPRGIVGGRWLDNPNRFIPSPSKRDINSIRETADYISVAEPNGLQIRDEYGRWPIIDGAVFGGVLPQVNIVPEYDGGKTPEDDYTYYAGSLPTVTIEGHKPTLWENIGNWFVDASKRAAFNENPAVMTASGWTPYPDGSTRQDAFNTPERNQLADNLKEIGIMGASDVWGGPLTEYVVGKYALPFAYKTMTAVDNKLRNIYAPYDLLRTIETTTPSIDDLNKMWYQRELTFESPMKISRFHENPKVGDFIDYGFGQGVLKGVSRNTPLSELTELQKEAVQKLYTNPAVSGEWFPKYRGSKGSKLIHQNETGAQPISSTGFVAKDATNSNSPWLSSMQGQPEIWYNRNKPYYSALGYRSYQDIPETLITNQEVAEQLGLHFNGTHGKDVSRVLSAPEELPFNAVEYGIKPNIFGSFDRIVYQKPLQKIISPPYVRSIPENEKLVYKIQELAK